MLKKVILLDKAKMLKEVILLDEARILEKVKKQKKTKYIKENLL